MRLFRKTLSEEKRQARIKNRRVHMANERTFLAWTRTCIGIMAFGFVVEKFIVHCDQNMTTGVQCLSNGCNYIVFFGIFLVFLGAGAGLLAAYRYLKTEKEIMEDTYHPSVVTDILMAILLSSIGILLAICLLHQV